MEGRSVLLVGLITVGFPGAPECLDKSKSMRKENVNKDFINIMADWLVSPVSII